MDRIFLQYADPICKRPSLCLQCMPSQDDSDLLDLAPLLDLGHYPKSIEDKALKFTEDEWKLIKGSSEL